MYQYSVCVYIQYAYGAFTCGQKYANPTVSLDFGKYLTLGTGFVSCFGMV